ncbi:hypothetical protein LX64_02820 [Chitinophaga skermanii]|uniref:Lipoprotein n=1 Tax=Chitinophaga skermanii TaxID=331697 RepID=A0A327QKR7_9BACT|nr:hypothetical protein [Chitinophaga skermanii]RAJ03943.1 hypothetical protein LX64_02820 [Chitinophaga skermanii]
MRKYVLLLVVAGTMCSCRSQKVGCPTNERNKGAEKVLDEMSAPPKKKGFLGLFGGKRKG